MKPRLCALTCLLFAIALAGVAAGQGNQKAENMRTLQALPYAGDLPSLAAVNIRTAKLENLMPGLPEAWAMEFLNEDELIITQIRGQLSRFRISDRLLTKIDGLPEIATDKQQTGLLDVEVDPDFVHNQQIYISYTVRDPKIPSFYALAVASARLERDKLLDMEVILVAEPFGWSPSNFGGALEFDKDGYLFVTVGDRSEYVFSQDRTRLQGKVLRINTDGSTPHDNPFINDNSVDNRIYALGVRNPQGLHFDAQTGLMFETEHGPMGGDEVNIIVRGENYGWPLLSYGQDYTSAPVGAGTHKSGYEQPLWYYLPSQGISPISVYRGPMFPEWEGHLLVGTLKGHHVSKLAYDGGVIRSERAILGEINDRIRDIKIASNGSIFILAETTGIFRLYRNDNDRQLPPDYAPELRYSFICSGCHDTGAVGAPILSDPASWKPILAQPISTIYQHTFDGKGQMPERGLCHICSDDQLRAVIDYMLAKVRSNEPADKKLTETE